MKRAPLLFLFLGITLPARVHAQDSKLLVADASSSGTYHQMLSEISRFCSSGDLSIEEARVKGGATDNLAALANNKVSIAFLHSDVIYAMSVAEPSYKKLKTLIALYPEEIHVVALRDSGIKTGGVVGFGGRTVTFTNLGDLKGYKVAAAGGGAITAKLLQGNGEAGFSFVQKDTGAELMAALDSHEVQAIIFVGGSPLANIEQLDGSKYKLLPIPEVIATRVQSIYHPATINYPNLKSGPVRTLAPDAIILTREYKSPRMIAPQKKFRDCFFANLDDLKETPGLHRKWQDVDASNHGPWDWYEIPGSATPVGPPSTVGPPSRAPYKKW